MSDLEEKLKDLSQFYNNQNLAQLTENQLTTDFNYCNINLPWTLNLVITIHDVHRKLAGNIHDLVDNKMSDLMNLLYKVDVDEEEIKKIFDIEDPEMRSNRLTWLIINRELKKVIIKEHYSSES